MAQNPDIVLLSMMADGTNVDDEYTIFESALRSHLPAFEVLRFSNFKDFRNKIRYEPPLPRMIIVLDYGIFHKKLHPLLLEIFFFFLIRGGILMFGFKFVLGEKIDIDLFFLKHFRLPWTIGDRYSGNFTLNQDAAIPNVSKFPEYYNNLGGHQLQSFRTFDQGQLIKGPEPCERIYVPCKTLEPPSDLLHPERDTRPRPSDEPQNWTYDSWTFGGDTLWFTDVDGVRQPFTRPLDDHQTILAGAYVIKGYLLLSGNCVYNEQYWQIIEALLLAPEKSLGGNSPASEIIIICDGDNGSLTVNTDRSLKTLSPEISSPGSVSYRGVTTAPCDFSSPEQQSRSPESGDSTAEKTTTLDSTAFGRSATEVLQDVGGSQEASQTRRSQRLQGQAIPSTKHPTKEIPHPKP